MDGDWQEQRKRGVVSKERAISLVRSRGAACIKDLKTSSDWDALLSLDSAASIFWVMNQLRSGWLTELREKFSLNLAYNALRALSVIEKDRVPGTLMLLNEFFTNEFILKIVDMLHSSVIKEMNPASPGMHQFLELLKVFRNSLMYVLCNEKSNSRPYIVEALDECQSFVSRLYQYQSDVELIDINLVCEFSAHCNISIVRMSNSVYPHDFLAPTKWLPNRVKGPFKSREEYVTTHFNLLKEDFDSNLRKGVETLLQYPHVKNSYIWIYRDVCISLSAVGYSKSSYRVHFQNQTYFSKVSWEGRFLSGSLLLITSDNFLTYHFATVEYFRFDKMPILYISMLSVPRNLNDGRFLLIEPTAFFPPYLYTMLALKIMLDDGVPFENYIVGAGSQENLPSYLRSDVMYNIGSKMVNITDPESWLSAKEVGLNLTQRDAFFSSLTNEVALIQGPPGTGKTFLAVKILRCLMKNKNASFKDGPILIVCYKNHALDQLLERFDNSEKVLRIGGQSKNDSMNGQRNLRNHRCYFPNELIETKIKWRYTVSKNFDRVSSLTSAIAMIGGNIGIVRLEFFKQHKIVSGSVDINIVSWLLGQQCRSIGSLSKSSDPIFALTLNMLTDYLEELTSPNGFVPYEVRPAFYKISNLFHTLHFYLKEDWLSNITGSAHFDNLCKLDIYQRWSLYFFWQNQLLGVLEEKCRMAQESLLESQKALKHNEDESMVYKIKSLNPLIIGLTTTAAARHHQALAALGPKIVLVEEAAEVLESHIISSLSTKCQHLILIGDHQQLRPSLKSKELESKSKMDVSLFERLINNGIKWIRLTVQFRMRPEISALISPIIYKDLTNDTVFKAKDSESKYNVFEASMVVQVLRYLLQQEDTAPSAITVLCAYAEQVKIVSRKWLEVRPKPMTVKFCCVDNYQGEENDIVLLSLVRSNTYGNVGFLSLANRICVGLSRAKNGLYLFGDINCLASKDDSIWIDIKKVLSSQEALSNKLPLKCSQHNNITWISKPSEFSGLPYGGCKNLCAKELECGHVCCEVCHGFDQNHVKEFLCRQPCLRKCQYGHKCLARCDEYCPPCVVEGMRELDCGHNWAVSCSAGTSQELCGERVTITLERCGHEQHIRCRLLASAKAQIICRMQCKKILECGHLFKYKCKQYDEKALESEECQEKCNRINPNCPVGHECIKKCYAPCENCEVDVTKLLNCGHKKMMKCFESIDTADCASPCLRLLSCRHQCRSLCSSPCGECREKVRKKITKCGHVIEAECNFSEAMLESMCNAKCEKSLQCGHPCPGKCYEDCKKLKCPTKVKYVPPCNHPVKVLCHVLNGDELEVGQVHRCKYKCEEMLPCGHRCRGTCSTCFQGRLHMPCTSRCDAVLLCTHSCQSKCSLLYHSCNDRRCVNICHKQELKARKEVSACDEFSQPWHENQYIFNAIILELRRRLTVYLQMVDSEYQYDESELSQYIANAYEFLINSTFRQYSGPCGHISFVKSSVFLAELLTVVRSAIPKIAVNASVYKLFEELLMMVSVRMNEVGSLGPHEIRQLKCFTTWSLLLLDFSHLKALDTCHHRSLDNLELLDFPTPSDEHCAELWNLIDSYKNLLGAADFSVTPLDREKLFPLTTELASPVMHHSTLFFDDRPENDTQGKPKKNCALAAKPETAVDDSKYSNILTDIKKFIASIEAKASHLKIRNKHEDDLEFWGNSNSDW